jgi:hypothetical protein
MKGKLVQVGPPSDLGIIDPSSLKIGLVRLL